MKRRLSGTQKWADRFNCGHPRSPENSTAKVRAVCKQCHHARDKARLQAFACKHPATPENTVTHVGPERTIRRCKTCHGKRVGRAQRPPRTIRLLQPPLPRAITVRSFCDVQAGRSYSLALRSA